MQTAGNEIRLTPAVPLTAGVAYGLVLDETHEIAFAVDASQDGGEAEPESIETDEVGTITLRFRQRANPLALRRGIEVTAREKRVGFTMNVSLDGREVGLVPESVAGGVNVNWNRMPR